MNQNLNTITESIIGCAYTLANTLGHGFIEKMMDCIAKSKTNYFCAFLWPIDFSPSSHARAGVIHKSKFLCNQVHFLTGTEKEVWLRLRCDFAIVVQSMPSRTGPCACV